MLVSLHICYWRTVRQVAEIDFFIPQHEETRWVVHKKRDQSKERINSQERESSSATCDELTEEESEEPYVNTNSNVSNCRLNHWKQELHGKVVKLK